MLKALVHERISKSRYRMHLSLAEELLGHGLKTVMELNKLLRNLRFCYWWMSPYGQCNF